VSGFSRTARVGSAAQLACLLEAAAPKPGNVSPGRDFADVRFEHFLSSAAAIAPAFADAASSTVGAIVRRAIEATCEWAPSNTNLGIVLLLAPLARAAHETPSTDTDSLILAPIDLRSAVLGVLARTTVEDAVEVYAAIRLASPGGLGRAPSQDVSAEPNVTLLEAMRLAENRDGIAREYATGYDVTFGKALPSLERARRDGLGWSDAIVECFLTVLAANLDTHIVRRAGQAAAAEVTGRAAAALAAGGVRTELGRRTIEEMDRALRTSGNTLNPGTTADLMAAAIFVELLAGGWNQPVDRSTGRR
jgi:triphosphoribosyl-dephospho-CoA synthase